MTTKLGDVAGRTVAAGPEEVELFRLGRHFSEEEKKKAVKWFVAHGKPLPTDSEIAALLEERQQRIDGKMRDARAADRQRLVAVKETTPLIAFTKHPLYMSQEAAALEPAPNFSTVALNGITGRIRMASSLDTLCRTVLLRLRVERRLQRATKMLKQSSDKLQSVSETSQLSLVELVSFLPSSDGNFELGNLPRPEPSPAQLDVFDLKEMKVPFEYKLKAYTTLKFAEHHFSNADGDEFVRVLAAGVDEVPEQPTIVPQIDHFVQPLVTLETFPMQPFSWVRTTPWEGVILGRAPQQLSDGGIKPRHVEVNYSHITLSLNKHLDVVREQLMVMPLPAPIREPQADDELSDDDGEESELPTCHPAGLSAIADWLPKSDQPLSPRSAPSASTVFPTVQTIGNCNVNSDFTSSQKHLASWLDEVTEELPPTIPF